MISKMQLGSEIQQFSSPLPGISVTQNEDLITLSNNSFMKTSNSSTFACRYCRYYVPEGRRGGNCQQLNVAVQGAWKACSLAIPPFTPAWENLEEIIVWQKKTLATQEATLAISAQQQASVAQTEEKSTASEAAPCASGRRTAGIKALWS